MTDGAARTIRVLWNPDSGYKGGVQVNRVDEESLRETLARHGVEAEFVATAAIEEVIASAKQAVEAGYDLVVAGGGDGTVGAVAKVLLNTETTLGILPLGSVMNMARMLGVPRDLDEAAAVLATGTTRIVDVGEANGETFYEGGSVGISAAVFREAQRTDRGDYRGVFTTIWALLRYRRERMRVHLDNRVLSTRALMVAVANGPYMGLAYTVAPNARLDDGMFDVVIFRRFSRWELIRHFRAIAFENRQYSPKIVTYRSRSVRIESTHPVPCRVDDHDLGTTPVTFVSRRAALRVLVPAVGPTPDPALLPEVVSGIPSRDNRRRWARKRA